MRKNRIWPYVILIFCISIFTGNTRSLAQDKASATGSLIVMKCIDFDVTGDGASEEWEKTGWIDLVSRGPEAEGYHTRTKVLYSETGIYFLFDCKDKKLTTTMEADNLNLWEEDVVEVFLWTDERFPVYFEYELSPMNYELPIIVPNFDGKFLGWLPWKYYGDKKTRRATSVTGGEKKGGSTVTGWMAEFFIPYKLLEPLNNVPPVSGTKWRANMYRLDRDSGTLAFNWQKTNITFHEYKNFGIFIFE
jgi:hypothetical protein